MAHRTCSDCGIKLSNQKAQRCRACYQSSRLGRICDMDECERTYFANGMCRWHFNRSKRRVANIKPCDICGKVITNVGNRRYCSPECGTTARAEQSNQWRRDRPEFRSRESSRQRLKRHGINPDEFVMPTHCDICGRDGETLAVDHDHECCSGKYSCGRCIRGFLCNNCNNGLGRFRDDPALLESAIKYLRVHS